MSSFTRGLGQRLDDLRTLAIILTDSLLEWLRVLPSHRSLHMLKLLVELLRKHGEQHWSARLEESLPRCRQALDSNDPDRWIEAMQELLTLYGGMGSLNDLYLSPLNGHKIKDKEVESVNARLGALRTQLYLSARQTIARIEWRRNKDTG